MRRELPSRGGLFGAPPRESRGDRRNNQPAGKQAEPEDEARRREKRGGDRDGDCSREQRNERRPNASEVQVLERVDVCYEAGEQISPAEALEPRRCQWLDAVVDPAANTREEPKGEVVGAETVEIACDRSRDAEEAHADDRSRERKDRRPLRGPRDQVAGRRHQTDPEDDGRRPERDRERNA